MPENDIILQIFEIIGVPAPTRLIFVLKVISAIISIILGWAVILLVFKSGYLNYVKGNVKFLKSEYTPLKSVQSKVTREWEAIVRRLETGDEANFKLAIIETDKLVDTLLKSMGYPGDSMGDRLKLIDASQLKSIQNLWNAHKVRNNIVHNAEFKLSYNEAKNTIEQYEKVLREMEALD